MPSDSARRSSSSVSSPASSTMTFVDPVTPAGPSSAPFNPSSSLNDTNKSPVESVSNTPSIPNPKPPVTRSKTNKKTTNHLLPTTAPSTAAPQAGFPLTDGAPLARTTTSTSVHAHNSLRRMVTHETGEMSIHHTGAELEDDGLHTHDEHEHEDSGHSSSDISGSPRDEEEAIGLQDSQATLPPGGREKSAAVKGVHGKEGKKAIELQDQTNLLPTKQVILVFCGLTCAIFCSLLDQTIVTTALPTLGRVFNRADITSWVGTAYLLTSTAFQPIYGRLSDIFGRKFVLLGSLFIFLMGSLACSLAQTMIQLIVFRALQGLGGGGILTLSMIIVSDVVSLKDRGKYQGITGGVVAISNSIGPILGGIFTEKLTWRWCFYINLPLTAASIVIIIYLLPLRRVKGNVLSKLRKVDYYGSILTLAWAVLVLIALSWGGTQYSWSSAPVLAPLIVGIVLLLAFLWIEAKLVPLPLIPMYIFKNGTVAASMATTFLSGAAFYSTLYYLPTYFQVVLGVTAIRSGVLLLPLVTVQTVFAFSSGILVSKTGDFKINLYVGFAVWTVGLGLLSTINENTSIAALAGYQVITGVGAGQTFQTSLIAIQAAVDRKDMATATGTRNFLRMLGGTVALAVCSAIMNNTVRTTLGGIGVTSDAISTILADPTQVYELGFSAAEQLSITQAYAKGVNNIYYFLTPMAGISFFLTVLFVKPISLRRADDAAKKAEAKAWIEEKKRKHRKGSGHDSFHEGENSHSEDVHGKDTVISEKRTIRDSGEHGESVAKRMEEDLEIGGKGVEEAAGGGDGSEEGSVINR